MAKVVVKAKVKKVKRKFPVEVKGPAVFNSVSLGHSNVTDLSKFVGNTLKINLMYVTKNVRNQNVRLTFQVKEVNSGVATSEVISYEQIPYYLNRFIKAGSDLITDSFVCKSSDGKDVRIKPFIITRKNTSGMILSSIRDKVIEIISKEVADKTGEEFIHAVSMGKVQVGFRNEIKKIFPLKTFEFKKVVLE